MTNKTISELDKSFCTGCEACANVCPTNAISMQFDDEEFTYPYIDNKRCVKCGKCLSACQIVNKSIFNKPLVAYGGYSTDPVIRNESSSGGAFSTICKKLFEDGYVVFGVEGNGIEAKHSSASTFEESRKFRGSKYVQSRIGDTYRNIKQLLIQGKKVAFSGTPCQNAGLKLFLNGIDVSNLLTIEVICEGYPTPLYIKKYKDYFENKYKKKVANVYYRYKGKLNQRQKWDFQVMKIEFDDGKSKCIDRWFNPFWSIWLQHLMSRPSCYNCQFTKLERVADITLGDLWGVHIYCPELYGKNGGSSLILCNTEKGRERVTKSFRSFYFHELDMQNVVRYQSPLRKSININLQRNEFMSDIKGYSNILAINKRWNKQLSIKIILSKYLFGNKQSVSVEMAKRKLFKR